MKCENLEEFFITYLSMLSIMVDDDKKLTYKEICFLTKCAIYNFEGNDLNDFEKLASYFLNLKFFKRKNDVSMYKYKLSIKKWVISNSKEFVLPGILSSKNVKDFKADFKLEYVPGR